MTRKSKEQWMEHTIKHLPFTFKLNLPYFERKLTLLNNTAWSFHDEECGALAKAEFDGMVSVLHALGFIVAWDGGCGNDARAKILPIAVYAAMAVEDEDEEEGE